VRRYTGPDDVEVVDGVVAVLVLLSSAAVGVD